MNSFAGMNKRQQKIQAKFMQQNLDNGLEAIKDFSKRFEKKLKEKGVMISEKNI